MREPDLDEDYHEYCWGEPSPRAFAKKRLVAGARTREPRSLEPQLMDVDLGDAVAR